MRQFLAILKDSFREAVDGFVIYLMLILSALLIVLIGSISYAPDSPSDAIPRILGESQSTMFKAIFPDRGKSAAPTGSPIPMDYRTSNIKDTTNGAQFVLNIGPPKELGTPKMEVKKGDELKKEKKSLENDGFRYTVFAWLSPAGEKLKNPFGDRGNGNAKGGRARTELELVRPPVATAADLESVTEEDMVAFLKFQFATFVGIDDVTVTRRRGIEEPDYQFDMEIKGIAGSRGWPHSITVFFGAVPPIKGIPLGQAIKFIQDTIVNGIGAAVTLMLSVVITAFFVPNLLRKGSIDLLISKPIGRSQLLIYKYIGGLTFIFLLSAVTIGGVWFVMAIRSGMWNPSFLLVIPVLTFTFAILYSVSTVVAVFTRSAIAAILVALGFMLCLYIFGQVKTFFDANKVMQITELPDWSYTLVDGLNNVLPRYKDLDKLTTKLVVDSALTPGEVRLQGIFTEYPSWTGAIGVSLGFIAVMLAISCWRFTKRDY